MTRSANPYEQDLDQNPANYAPLTPLAFIDRAAAVYPDNPAVIHGERRYTWRETYERARRLGSALARRGVGLGDTVSVVLANVPAMIEAHFGVPMTGGVLNTINTRLDAETIAFMLEHGEAKVLLTDPEFAPTIEKVLARLQRKIEVIDVEDPSYEGESRRLGDQTYEGLLAEGDPQWQWRWPANEWEAIALNYTSGTTGNPKGVVFHHRGAYLNAIGNILAWGMPTNPVYLWTLPMFHCNGWCFPWSLAAVGGTSVCLRKVDPARIFPLIRQHRVTHYCGAPIVHQMLLNAPDELKQGIDHTVHCMVAGAAPPASVFEGLDALGFRPTHVYGLTETYGPATLCAQQPGWAGRPLAERVALNGRQGVRYPVVDGLEVMDPETMTPTPADGQTLGEVMFRGNITMKGYLKNPAATEECFRGGWFHSGDLAVKHPDGYLKIKDRSKDIIISGGENISSLEVEEQLYRHPAVMAAAVVPMPDAKWGETPCAFIELKPGAAASEDELLAFCRQGMAPFKVPRAVVFGELPKTSTGKIQKFVLRQRAKSASAIDT